MAMFHFRLKSDKKPNGTKISAVHHVKYINREENISSQEQWEQKNKFVGNFITTAETKDLLDGQNALLYKTDDFGSIRNSANGIEVTENASETTIAIALLLSHEAMNHQPLILHGSPLFQKAVIQAAIQDDLPVSFADKLTQNAFLHQKEALALERKIFVANGGSILTKRPIPQPCHSPAHAKSIEDATKIGLRLPTLSQRFMVHSESKGTDLLLSSDESDMLDELAKKSYNLVRWNFSSERKQLAQRTATQILENIQETEVQSSAKTHVEYINREKAFEKRGGCIFHSHRLPKWAHDDPKKFFQAADKYEGKGNRRYMEIEFALPNELKTVEHEDVRRQFQEQVSDLARKNFFAFDLNPDLVKAAKMNMVMNNDGSGNIWQANVTNPSFGSKIPIDDEHILRQFELAHIWTFDEDNDIWYMTNRLQSSVPPEILFVERCTQFLKPGGRMGIVLPDSILGSPGLGYIRTWIIRNHKILASIDLHADTFQSHNGAQTSVLILRKKTPEEILSEERHGIIDYEIFMAQVEKVGHDKRGNSIFKRDADGREILIDNAKVLDDETTEVARAYNYWKKKLPVAAQIKFFITGKNNYRNHMLCNWSPAPTVIISK